MERVRAFVIHLERARERAGHVAALLDALPVPGEIVAAVDGRDGAAQEAARYDPALGLRPAYPFALSETEIAVFHSHRRAWARIAQGDAEAGLVLEDDVVLDGAAFGRAFDLARAVAGSESFVRLPMKDREQAGVEVAAHKGVRAVRPALVGLNLQASLVGRGAAARLLSASAVFDRPVDTWLQLTWEHGVDVLSVWPSGVGEMSRALGGSTQRKRKGLAARLRAEVLRARYRAALAARARRG